MLCRWGKQKCGQCQAWLIVSCVFCGAVSPHNVSNCMRCNEAFAGAAQRKAMMEQQRQQQVQVQQVNAWGGVAASFLGAAAGVAIGGAFSSDNGCSSADTFDISGVSDDTSFDFGGDD
jgi:hypothetical protein